MKLGIIGLPGSGRSTLFGTLTGGIAQTVNGKKEAVAVVRVPDERVDFLTEQFHPRKTTYAQVEYLLPGDVPSGETGKGQLEGLCNQVRNCDAMVHVVRNFHGNGAGAASPDADLVRLEQEMVFSDFRVVEKRIERIQWEKKRGKPVNVVESELLTKCLDLLETDTPIRRQPDLASNPILRGYSLVSAKPKLVLFNNEDEDDALPPVNGAGTGAACMAIQGKIESELAGMSEEEAREFLADFGISRSAMNRVIQRSYDLLGLASFFTVGEDEVRAWTIRSGTKAVDAAAVIHSDIQKGFIRAEIVAYNDFRETGGMAEARKKGKVRLEGKEYPVQDGDIINFRFNV
jgi:GTP-binding protein YchF